ncbi:hypothetical protein [Nocardia sp. CA-145437]|uniref:hypothetical protein n=1 Tax=Nocardia sp. CA-145437 TaxID=3239980 RepID=UPI003D986D1F
MNTKTHTVRIGLAGLSLAAALAVAAGPAVADIPLTPVNEPTAVADTTGTGSWQPATGSANSNVIPFISPGSAEIMRTVTDATGSTCSGCTNTPR